MRSEIKSITLAAQTSSTYVCCVNRRKGVWRGKDERGTSWLVVVSCWSRSGTLRPDVPDLCPVSVKVQAVYCTELSPSQARVLQIHKYSI